MTTLQMVHDVYKKYLYIEEPDGLDFIDVALATYLTKDLEGDPLWMLPVAPSGYGKTAQLYPLIKLGLDFPLKYNIQILDQATANAFASGAKDKESDIGAFLNNRKSLLLIPIFHILSEDSFNLIVLFIFLFNIITNILIN